MKRTLALLAGLAVSPLALASTLVAANVYASTPYAPATGLNTFIRDSGNARTGQLIINSNQLAGLNVGDTITGMAFRLYNGLTGTYTGANWTSYDIRIGESVAPSASTATFATNFVGATTLVQTGALTMSGFSQTTSGATPNAWCNDIVFSTPFIYTGGHIAIEVRHTGSDIVNPANAFLESVATTGIGSGTDYISYTATGNAATAGALNTFTMTRLTYSSVPEPATMALLGAGALALLRRRRK